MATSGGPNKIDDNLIFYYDIDNEKFYKGPPSTNLITTLGKAFGSWSGLTGFSKYYTRNGSTGVQVNVKTGGGVHWYESNMIENIQPSTQYTISATIKYSRGTTPHPNLFYVRQYGTSGQTSESGRFSASSVIDLGRGWKRAYRTFTTDAAANRFKLQGYQYNAGARIRLQDLQVEIGPTLTPYKNGAVDDYSAIKNIAPNDLQIHSGYVDGHDSFGRLYFDGASDRLSIANPSYPSTWSDPFSFEVVMNVPASAAWSNGGSGTTIIGRGGYGGSIGLIRSSTGNRVAMWVRTDSNIFDPAILNLSRDTYHHIVGTWDGTSTAKIYHNGTYIAQEVSTNISGVPDNDAINVGGGNSYGGTYGHFGEGEYPIGKMYSKALTAEEVRINYNAVKGRFGI